VSRIASFFDWLAGREGKDARTGAPAPLSHRYCITFSSLVRDNWDDLKKLTNERSFARGEAIYSIDDPASRLYMIALGKVKVVRLSERGQEKTMGMYQTRDFFGEVCLCEASRREEQALAMEPTTVAVFDTMELMRMFRKRTELMYELLMVVCARLYESQEEIARLVFDDVRARLAKQLLVLESRANQAPLAGPNPVTLTHEELAHLVSSTRENVTAIPNEFRRMGLVDYRAGQIFVFPPQIEAYLRRNRHGA